jgi:hypothetical protein
MNHFIACESVSPTVSPPPTLGPTVGLYSVVMDGYEYRTVMDGVRVEGEGGTLSCHDSVWRRMPDGYDFVPDTVELRNALIMAYTWSTHVVVFGSWKAYRTAGFLPAGLEFGDHQDKARTRFADDGTTEVYCPWTCYQVIVRRPVEGAEDSPTRNTSTPAAPPTAGMVSTSLLRVASKPKNKSQQDETRGEDNPETLAPPLVAPLHSPTAALRTQESDNNTTGSRMIETAEHLEGEGPTPSPILAPTAAPTSPPARVLRDAISS